MKYLFEIYGKQGYHKKKIKKIGAFEAIP